MYTFYFGSIRGMATTFYRGKEDMSSYAVRVGQFFIIGKREDRKKEERNQRETRCLEHVKVLKKRRGKKKPRHLQRE